MNEYITHIRIDARRADTAKLNSWKVLENNIVLDNIIAITTHCEKIEQAKERAIKLIFEMGFGELIQNHITHKYGLEQSFYLDRIK